MITLGLTASIIDIFGAYDFHSMRRLTRMDVETYNDGLSVSDPLYLAIEGVITLEGKTSFVNTNQEIVAIIVAPFIKNRGSTFWVFPIECVAAVFDLGPGENESLYHFAKIG